MMFKHKKSPVITLDCLGGTEICVARNRKEIKYLIDHNYTGEVHAHRMEIAMNARGCYIGTVIDGVVYFAVGFNEDFDFTTVIHEASHLVDMVFEQRGIPFGTESTEIRAYTLQYICQELFKIMGVKYGL
ncbi:hypothetical protein [uncultured Deefgea sp.]|uniref:hypothetical protein n=1 Tax=uncultured Deefgea sp. TaxID=1304914 RepID=UPI00262A8CBC|nr:hypothetical protein [uncultured Deefgea sp.]